MYLATHLVKFLKKDAFEVLSLENPAVKSYSIPSTLQCLSSTVPTGDTSEYLSTRSLTVINAAVSEEKIDPVVLEFPVIDEIISIVVEKYPIDANKNNVKVFRNEAIDCILDKIFDKFEERTNVAQSTIRKGEFKDFAKEIVVPLFDSGLFYFNIDCFLHHDKKKKNVSQEKLSQRRPDNVPKDYRSSADKPHRDNSTSLDIPGPSKSVCNYQENQRDFSDSALMVSSSLSDLLVSILRLLGLSESLFMLQLPSFTVHAPISENLWRTRKDIMQAVITVSLFCHFREII